MKSSIFCTGWVLNGRHRKICAKLVEFSREVQLIRKGGEVAASALGSQVRVSFTQLIEVMNKSAARNRCMSYNACRACGSENKLEDLLEAEQMGCEPPRWCKAC